MPDVNAGNEKIAHAVPGAEGNRISTFNEDVATALVSDNLAAVGNAGRVEIIALLNKIRVLCLGLTVLGLVVLLGVGGMFLYIQDTRRDVNQATDKSAMTQAILCSIARDFEQTLEDNITIPEECPQP